MYVSCGACGCIVPFMPETNGRIVLDEITGRRGYGRLQIAMGTGKRVWREKNMKTLIVEDDFTSRLLLQQFLKEYGPVHTAFNGKEALEAVKLANGSGEPYDLICLDIMMPEMDGQRALKEIRAAEEAKGLAISRWVKIIMTTALADRENVIEAIRGKCDAFLVKPIKKTKLLEELRRLNLIG